MTFDSTATPAAPARPAARRATLSVAGLALSALFAAAPVPAAMPAPRLHAATPERAPQGSGIDFAVTLGTDLSEGACGTDTTLDVTQLDQVNFCYTVTNTSTTPLAWHSLSDDVTGSLLSAIPYTLAPGATLRYNRIVTARASQSPVSTWTAWDVHPGYADQANVTAADHVFGDGFDGDGGNGGVTYDFVDITGTGTPLDSKFDDGTTQADIGFTFSYYGQDATQLMVAYNGGLLFDLATGYLTPQNVPLPDPDIGAAILPYWTDIYYQQPEDGNIYVQTLGSAPNRRFVVEWFNLPIMIGGIQQDSATFEAVLYEGSNAILFQYADTSVGDPARDDGITTTIGLNPPAGVEAALQYSYHEASVGAGKAILFTPTNPVTFSAAQQVDLAVGVPQITVDPPAFNVSAGAGASTGATLTIGNVGNRPLTWNIGEFSPSGHFPPVSRFALPQGDPAQTSPLPAPRHARGTALARHPHGTAAVPSFGIDFDSSGATWLVSFDSANPTDLWPVGDLSDLILSDGVFVDEDFSHLYTIDFYTWHLLSIDTATGARSLVGTVIPQPGAGDGWAGMSWDSSSNTLYAIGYAQSRSGLTSYLYTIDPVTAAATLVGPITGIGNASAGTLVSAIAVNGQGQMFGVELVSDQVVAIDRTSGNASVLGSLGFDANYAQGLDFDDYTGTLYYAAWNNTLGGAEMYTIDTLSGALALVAPIGGDAGLAQVTGLSIARLGGVCAYPNDVPWLAFDSSRGSTAPGDASPVQVTFDASALSAGTYHAYVCVANNDLTNRRVPVPVTFTVN